MIKARIGFEPTSLIVYHQTSTQRKRFDNEFGAITSISLLD
jgi:hypothetical protein